MGVGVGVALGVLVRVNVLVPVPGGADEVGRGGDGETLEVGKCAD
jgi:hypothetical protein